jgi:hypothetical protein
MTRRSGDAFALALYGQQRQRPAPDRRRARLRNLAPFAVALVAVVVAAVVLDLPSPSTPAAARAAAVSIIDEVNSDVGPCAFAVSEASTLYRDEMMGELTAAHRRQVPTLLQDDAGACSFTSSGINDLSGIDEPGSGAGKYLSLIVSSTLSWTTSDALGAIDDVVALTGDRGNVAAARNLAVRQRALATDRRAAAAALGGSERVAHASLPALDLPVVRFRA